MDLHNLLPETIVALYLGPETIMPLASVLASGVGLLLIFWRHVLGMVRRTYRRIFVRRGSYEEASSSLDTDTESQVDSQ